MESNNSLEYLDGIEDNYYYICPHCEKEYEVNDCEECIDYGSISSKDIMTCENCNKDFTYWSEHTASYHTSYSFIHYTATPKSS